jgi:hypothetical protein
VRWLAVLAVACSPPRVQPHVQPWHVRVARTGATTDSAHARIGALGTVAIREVALVPAPGALPVGVVLEPGYPLPPTVASWLHVHQDHPIRVDGWVPTSARGLFWQEMPPGVGERVSADKPIVVRDSPDSDGCLVAVLDPGVAAEISGEPGTWAPIEAVAGRVRVIGWAIVPPLRIDTFDFGDDVIEGDLVRPEGERD